MKPEGESLEALIKRGLREIVTLPCDSDRQAKSLRNELYSVRRKMEGDYSGVAFRIQGAIIKIGPAEQLERQWTDLK